MFLSQIVQSKKPKTTISPNKPRPNPDDYDLDSSLSLTEFKKEVMIKVQPTISGSKNDSVFRNPNHINEILSTGTRFQPSVKPSLITSYPSPMKGTVNTEIQRLNSDDSDAANDPTILEFRDALNRTDDQGGKNPNPRYQNKQTAAQTRNGSIVSILNALDRATDSNNTSFTLPNKKPQNQDSTKVFDLGQGEEWDLNSMYNNAMQEKWNSQKVAKGIVFPNQIKAADFRGGNRGSMVENESNEEYDIYKNYSNDNSIVPNQRGRGSINKGNQKDILDYFK